MDNITTQIVDEGIKHGDIREYLKDLSHQIVAEYYGRRAMGSFGCLDLIPPLDIPQKSEGVPLIYFDGLSHNHTLKDCNIDIKEISITPLKDKVPKGMSPSYHHILGKERRKKW